MPDSIYIRGEGYRTGVTLRSCSFREVRFTQDGVDHTVAGWRVAGIERSDRPAELTDGLDALEAAEYETARERFGALAGTTGYEGWGRFYLAQTERQSADLALTGWSRAALAYQAYLGAHPDDFFEPHARYGLALAAMNEGDFGLARRTLEPLADGRGDVWALMGILGRARTDRLAGDSGRALSRFAAVRDRADETPFAREAGQLAQVGMAETLREMGRPEESLRALPIIYHEQGERAAGGGAGGGQSALNPEGTGLQGLPIIYAGLPIIYTGLPIIYAPVWFGSVAAPSALNAMGASLRDAYPGPGGAAMSVPFHLRVSRYHSTYHAEHARALHDASAALEAAGLPAWADEVRGMLRERYPASGYVR